MKFMKKTAVASVLIDCTAINLVAIQGASAATLRVANQGDALSLDTHSLNESLQLSVVGNVYEGLVYRDRNYKLEPALANKLRLQFGVLICARMLNFTMAHPSLLTMLFSVINVPRAMAQT